MRACLALTLLLAVPAQGWAQSPFALCRAAIAAAERASGVPNRLIQAIGAVESGRRDEDGGTTAWPWTINAEGRGAYFNTKAEAIAAVTALRAQGVRSIDVGCMQVNLRHHPDAFASLEEAFDPATNARYAAQFLNRLYAQTGTWQGAASGYHSLTPELGGPYGRKVMAAWHSAPPIPPAQTAASTVTIPPAPFGPAMGGAVPARIIPLPSTQAGAFATTGRGLDSYRAVPTRLASRFTPG